MLCWVAVIDSLGRPNFTSLPIDSRSAEGVLGGQAETVCEAEVHRACIVTACQSHRDGHIVAVAGASVTPLNDGKWTASDLSWSGAFVHLRAECHRYSVRLACGSRDSYLNPRSVVAELVVKDDESWVQVAYAAGRDIAPDRRSAEKAELNDRARDKSRT